jgi:3'(2'), 5'-bisphosphate nucleotidase
MIEHVPVELPYLVKIKDHEIQFELLIKLIRDVGAEILKIYNSDDFGVQTKEDKSPVTKADVLAHKMIHHELKQLYPNIPMLSEEGSAVHYTVRGIWPMYWCVDPIDGTKEFIDKSGEFTINIALIVENQPVLGLIYAPVIDELYYSDGTSSFAEFENAGQRFTLPFVKSYESQEKIVAVMSKSFRSPKTQELSESLGASEFISKGSSLKFCLVAGNIAKFYIRDHPTYEWDTAAADAILRTCGKAIYELDTFDETDLTKCKRIEYNKPKLLNPSFIAI